MADSLRYRMLIFRLQCGICFSKFIDNVLLSFLLLTICQNYHMLGVFHWTPQRTACCSTFNIFKFPGISPARLSQDLWHLPNSVFSRLSTPSSTSESWHHLCDKKSSLRMLIAFSHGDRRNRTGVLFFSFMAPAHRLLSWGFFRVTSSDSGKVFGLPQTTGFVVVLWYCPKRYYRGSTAFVLAVSHVQSNRSYFHWNRRFVSTSPQHTKKIDIATYRCGILLYSPRETH